jgi:hypothetical protein
MRSSADGGEGVEGIIVARLACSSLWLFKSAVPVRQGAASETTIRKTAASPVALEIFLMIDHTIYLGILYMC